MCRVTKKEMVNPSGNVHWYDRNNKLWKQMFGNTAYCLFLHVELLGQRKLHKTLFLTFWWSTWMRQIMCTSTCSGPELLTKPLLPVWWVALACSSRLPGWASFLFMIMHWSAWGLPSRPPCFGQTPCPYETDLHKRPGQNTRLRAKYAYVGP